MDKVSQISTISGVTDETGLTPIQQKAVMLLISGKNYTEVANELQIDRKTLYNWFEKISFQAYYNLQMSEIKATVSNGLLSTYSDAIQAIKDSLNSENEAVKLKAAFWLIEHFKEMTVGETNPVKMIKNVCTTNDLIFDIDFGANFNETKYKKLLSENGLNK